MGTRAYPISFIQDKRRSLGSTAGQVTEDFPVLPVSFGLLTITAVASSANTNDSVETMLSKIGSLNITFRGTQIWGVKPIDLYRLGLALVGWDAPLYQTSQGASSRRDIVLIIPFTRKPYDPFECFPATTRGECQSVINTIADPGNYGSYTYTLEWIQLPDAMPGQFIRATQLAITPNATGDYDVDLPRGAPLVGMGVVQSASEPAASSGDIEQIKILMANQDTWYPGSFMLSMRALTGISWGTYGNGTILHTHIENTAGSYTQNASTLTQVINNSPAEEFGWMPFDPTHDGKYILDGTKALDLKARITFNATNTVRLLPVELWTPAMIGKTNGKG